jgi:hypothetical protein
MAVSKENVKLFEELLKATNREGIEDLIAFIKKSDFYTAPASTIYHSCHEGGLLEHSINVYNRLKKKFDDELWVDSCGVKDENIVICALLHDLCKCYFYVPDIRNRKVYSETGAKRDGMGRYDWESYQSYTVDDKFPYGHGEKSVMMIEKFIQFEPIERYAIRWHMGFTEPDHKTLSAAIKKYPFILAINEADLEATYLLEEEE